MINAISIIIIFIFSLVIHENAHARVAYYFGDTTAKDLGRFSFNPLKHMHWIGTLLPIILYFAHAPMLGFAKPVPFYPSNFQRPKIDTIFVALAGPFSNLILSLIAFVIYDKFSFLSEKLSHNINNFFIEVFLINALLFAFNMLPIPPLDGSALILNCVSVKHQEVFEKILNYIGILLLLFLVICLPLIGELLNKDIDIIDMYIFWFQDALLRLLFKV